MADFSRFGAHLPTVGTLAGLTQSRSLFSSYSTPPVGGRQNDHFALTRASPTRRVGFRALKKALEAPYTTKVNNREPTTRGTTGVAG